MGCDTPKSEQKAMQNGNGAQRKENLKKQMKAAPAQEQTSITSMWSYLAQQISQGIQQSKVETPPKVNSEEYKWGKATLMTMLQVSEYSAVKFNSATSKNWQKMMLIAQQKRT
ncbi:hypothetical protein PoB_001497600 [Plakobranchus ocellatus]|uniref:Uncharacterized protein n=1 Tax=Plakobranchus ocellatus TaxID=259542 RepID=A0AAV3YY47_9GAST|nr:hypothetical protein PoB_001497600 [Plakobranchus ocellatus]